MKVAMDRINQALDRIFPFDLQSKELFYKREIDLHLFSSSCTYPTGLSYFTNS